MNNIKLSKAISYALRHAPWEYELELDEQGWVDVEQLLDALNASAEFGQVSLADLENMVLTSDKKRHEIKGRKIRAFYGHTMPGRIQKEESIPPETLYHGTASQKLESIKELGLLPMSRQYVHLSVDIKTAQIVGRRKTRMPVILKIDACQAYADGVKFYFGNDNVWLADLVPAKYITFI